MSLLAETSKNVVNAILSFEPPSSSSSRTAAAPTSRIQSYVQTGDPLVLEGSYMYGAFDANTTTFAVASIKNDQRGTLFILSNSAADASSPPNFQVATTLPLPPEVSVAALSAFNVALSADGLVCAASAFCGNGTPGFLVVYTRPAVRGQAWTRDAAVYGAASIAFGFSLSMSASGRVIAVGAWNDNNGVGSTKIYDFNRTTGALTLVTTLTGTGWALSSYVQQGWSVALSGDGLTLAVGALYDNSGRGAVWMFRNAAAGGTWTQTGAKLAPFNTSKPTAFVGQYVSLSFDGTRLAVAAQQNSLVQTSGSVFMYELVNGAWLQGQTIYPLGVTNTSCSVFVATLNYDGSVLVFDQPYNKNGEGGVFVYHRQANGLWVQNGAIRVPIQPGVPVTEAYYTLSSTSPTGSIIAVSSYASANIVLFA